jgi:carboxylate-amine ligase
VSRIDVVYRRTNEDRVRNQHGELTPVAQRVLEPWLSGKVGLVNAFGNGVADDKLIHSHVEDFIRFYLDEEPLLRSVPTSSVGKSPETIVDRLDELVVKPRHGHGGIGVMVGPHADAGDLARLADELRQDPTGYIAQPTITLSVHPTIVGDQLGLRHVDLRPFSFGEQLLPGGLSRVAFDEGALVVNSSQNGGGKDTWVMPD